MKETMDRHKLELQETKEDCPQTTQMSADLRHDIAAFERPFLSSATICVICGPPPLCVFLCLFVAIPIGEIHADVGSAILF